MVGDLVLVELAGLPGAGKSTIFERLLARDPRLAPMPILRRGPHRGILARELARTTATLLRHRAIDRSWDRDLVVMAAYLDALPPALAHGIDADGVVFDQGPIYTLCRRQLRHPRLARWRDERLARWAALLDLVVVLEAPDAVLLDRIEGRPKDHRLKGAEADAGGRALTADRAVLDDAIAAVERAPDTPRILRLDTSRHPPDHAAATILDAIRRPA